MDAVYTEKINDATGRRLEALLRRALCPAASDGEAENSAVHFVRACRRERIGFDSLGSVFRALPALEQRQPDACEVVLPWGKHQGRTLKWVAVNAPSYLRWLSEAVEDDFIREAAAVLREHFKRGAAA